MLIKKRDIKNIDRKNQQEMFIHFNAIKKRLVQPPKTKFSNRLMIHETIKCQLYMLGRQLGYFSVPEAIVETLGRRGRVDMLWVDLMNGGRIVCAFEIDYSCKTKSIAKLKKIKADNKFIISISPRSYTAVIKKPKVDLGEIRRFALYY